MSFHETRLREDVDWGASGGPGFVTSIVEVESGAEERVSRRAAARHRYSITVSDENLSDLKAFYMARGGAAHGWRFKDWADYHSNPEDSGYHAEPGLRDQPCLPAQGDGSTTQFQLRKVYVDGVHEHSRTITKPVSGTVRVWVNGSELLSGWTVDTTTGIVTFSSAPANGHDVEASFEFDVPVRFDESADQLLNINLEQWGRNIGSVGVVEILEPGPSGIGEINGGGCMERLITANYALSLGNGRLFIFRTTTASLSVILPAKASSPLGRSIFTVINDEDSTQSITVRDESNSSIAVLSPGEGVDLHLSLASNNTTRNWYGT